MLSLAVASAALAVQWMTTSGPDQQASSGMSAFSDVTLFVAVLAVASLPSTAGLLYFLRPYGKFWNVLRIVAIVIAATGIGAAVVYFGAKHAAIGSTFYEWSALAVLRILAAPMCCLGFFVCGLFAPAWPYRLPLFLTAATEAAVFGVVAPMWIYPVWLAR